jgi:RyR domain
MKPTEIARVAHEVNRAYCQALGDTSQLAWEEAPEWQRASAINGVHFHLVNPDAGPDVSHNAWLEEKRAAGWKYGPVKNPEAKEHPCFVPYDQLPVEQQAKDFLFRGVVRALATDIFRPA